MRREERESGEGEITGKLRKGERECSVTAGQLREGADREKERGESGMIRK